MGGKPCCGRFMRSLRAGPALASAARAACGGIIGATPTLLSTMLTAPKSLQNLDALSRTTMNDRRTLAHICAVPVPNETKKEQIAALTARGEQIKQTALNFC